MWDDKLGSQHPPDLTSNIEPMAEMRIRKRKENFWCTVKQLLSATKRPEGQPIRNKIPIAGAVGRKTVKQPIFHINHCEIKGKQFTHRFAWLPNCPVNLMGRDLVCNL